MYSLRGLDGVSSGDEVKVHAMVFGDCAIQVSVAIYNGEDRLYQVVPERGYDDYGVPLANAVIGEEYKATPQTAIERAATAMDGQAYAGLSADEIKAARAKRATPFNGELTAVRLKREQIQLVVDGDVVGTGVAARKGLLQGHLLEKSD